MATVLRFSALLLLFAVVIGPAPRAKAAPDDGTPPTDPPQVEIAYEIYPKGGRLGDYFQPTIEAGKSQELTVVLANTGSAVFEGRTYAINAYTAVNGGFEAADAGTPAEGVTTWLDYPEEVYTIDPGKGIERTFSVFVPDDTLPGQYLTAIAFENADPRPVEGSNVFNQIVRFPVPVLITVPGPVEPAFAVGEMTLTSAADASRLDIQIANTGNISVRPTGTVTVSDENGTALYSAQVSMGTVFARDATILQVGLPPLAEGTYQIKVDLTDPETKATAQGEATVTATAPATPPPPPPVQLRDASATPQPAADNVQFLAVTATIENTGEPLTNVQVVLHTTRDGETVEDFALASSLAVPTGSTSIEARYLPATGWTSGTWQFTLSLEVVGGNGVAQVIATADLGTLEIP